MNYRYRVQYEMQVMGVAGAPKTQNITRNVEVPHVDLDKKCLEAIRQVLVDTHKNESVKLLAVRSTSSQEKWTVDGDKPKAKEKKTEPEKPKSDLSEADDDLPGEPVEPVEQSQAPAPKKKVVKKA